MNQAEFAPTCRAVLGAPRASIRPQRVCQAGFEPAQVPSVQTMAELLKHDWRKQILWRLELHTNAVMLVHPRRNTSANFTRKGQPHCANH